VRQLSAIQKESSELATDIDEVAGTLTAHRSFSTVIETAVSRLDTIVAQSRELLPYDEESEGLDTLKNLERNYTMHSERVIHRAHTAAKKTGGNGEIAHMPIVESIDHFSNNVELFS
jgi:hypothetical protein